MRFSRPTNLPHAATARARKPSVPHAPRRPWRAACAALGLALISVASVLSPAAAEVLDTGALPRVAGAKALYASPLSTIYAVSTPVGEAAAAAAKALAGDGWRQYAAANAEEAKSDDVQAMNFKKGPLGLGVLVTKSNPATTANVNYTARPLANDLPFPPDATDIAFDPNQPLTHLRLQPADRGDARLLHRRARRHGLGAGARRAERRHGEGRARLFRPRRSRAAAARRATRRRRRDQDRTEGRHGGRSRRGNRARRARRHRRAAGPDGRRGVRSSRRRNRQAGAAGDRRHRQVGCRRRDCAQVGCCRRDRAGRNPSPSWRATQPRFPCRRAPKPSSSTAPRASSPSRPIPASRASPPSTARR